MSDAKNSVDVAKITEEVYKVIADKLSVKAEDIKGSSTFEELGADSLDTVELVMALEENEELNIGNISDEDAEKLKTVQDVIDYVVKRKSEEQA